MPTTFEIRGRLVLVTSDGAFSLEDAEGAVQRLLSDPAFEPGSSVLIDVRGSTESASAGEISERAEWFATLSRAHIKRCALVTGDPLQFGLARMFSSFADATGMEVRAFREMSEAESWLGGPVQGPPA